MDPKKEQAGGEQSGEAPEMNPKEPSQEELNKDMADNPDTPGTDNSESEGETSGDGAGVGTG